VAAPPDTGIPGEAVGDACPGLAGAPLGLPGPGEGAGPPPVGGPPEAPGPPGVPPAPEGPPGAGSLVGVRCADDPGDPDVSALVVSLPAPAESLEVTAPMAGTAF